MPRLRRLASGTDGCRLAIFAVFRAGRVNPLIDHEMGSQRARWTGHFQPCSLLVSFFAATMPPSQALFRPQTTSHRLSRPHPKQYAKKLTKSLRTSLRPVYGRHVFAALVSTAAKRPKESAGRSLSRSTGRAKRSGDERGLRVGSPWGQSGMPRLGL